MSDKFEFSNTGLIKPRKITRSEFSYVEPTVFDLATYTMVKREDLDYLEQQLSQKDEMISLLRTKFLEFISLVSDIEECDKKSADKINLWIAGNTEHLAKLNEMRKELVNE